MKRFFVNIMLVAVAATALVACSNDTSLDNPQPEKEQWVADGSPVSIKLGVKIPDPIEVATRAVDPDGSGIQTMTLFCFDEQGLLISTATATLKPNPNDPDNESGGIFDADIPNTTRIIHLLANQNLAQFKEDDFRNLSEEQVIADLEGSSGMMIYWARVEVPPTVSGNAGILEWFTVMTNPTNEMFNSLYGENYPIVMLRNQAKVMVDAGGTEEDVDKDWVGTYFKVEGFTVVNTQAFGTVAPYHTSYGYPTYACHSTQAGTANYDYTPSFGLTEGSTTNWVEENYVNLPRKSDKFSNITDVATAAQTYVYETENSSADPVSVIIKGRNIVGGVEQATKYYRVTLTDSEGEQVLVRRNHCYTVNIKGNLLYGVNTFGEALDAPATNNVWLSISDEVKSVQNKDYKLTVEKTGVVLDAIQIAAITGTPKQTHVNFSVEALGSNTIDEALLSISWVGDQDISTASPSYTLTKSSDNKSATGVIHVNLEELTDAKNEGTILVKYGHLQRKIKIVAVQQQTFTPTWVTGQVYTEVGTSGSEIEAANATLVFTIPEDSPAELFPMNVLITANELDVRSNVGQVLPIIRKGEEGYGEDNGIGYKYVFEVTEPGKHFVYLRSILGQVDGASTEIKIEAEHFQSVTKTVMYANNQRAISVTNLISSESATGSTKESDKIYYVYLPQKRYAPWTIDMKMIELVEGYNAIDIAQYDEFLLYSDNLDAYLDNEINHVKDLLPNNTWLSSNAYFPCQFVAVDESLWSTGGRVHAFMPRAQYYEDQNTSKSQFSIYMKTNKAKSAEIIRISSNQLQAKAAFTTEAGVPMGSAIKIYRENDNNEYLYTNKGTVNTYRSMVFELRNYPAFRFAAQVNGVPTYEEDYKDLSDNEEEKTPVQIEYKPGTEVEVSFDITSFMEEENDGVEAEVDPFGTDTYIYIQTPGLELVEEGLSEAIKAKITKMDDSGLYRYVVDNLREEEAEDWVGTTAIQSNEPGERKVITFKTKNIVTEGDIVIYTDAEQISYKTKTFNVTNAPFSGTITYGESNENVPAGQFISFSREIDGSRIGSVTVTEDGKYQMRLRQEYEFTWDQDDPVKLYAKIGSDIYTATYDNLAALYADQNIELVLTE
ncbi:MAG: hypothetical protein E7138_05235 [Rikenellaceae bacterium]|nr:hypothetical protein [Rikenellaceae bacterium]